MDSIQFKPNEKKQKPQNVQNAKHK